MKAVLLKGFGGVEQLYIGETAKPKVSKNGLLVKVKAAGVNRADTQQRKGKYPAPKGESDILGLEVSGIIEEVGEEVKKWKVGDNVMALLSGGGYAEYVSIPSDLAMPIPTGYSFEEAAAVPETFLTTFQSLFWIGQIQRGQSVLIHGGASGIGTSAIQLAKSLPDVRVFTTAGTEAKCKACLDLGVEMAINYKEQPNFDQVILEATKNGTGEAGVDFILDFVGQNYIQKNINLLRTDGKLVYLAMLSGPIAEKVDLGPILRKRLTIQGTTLRSRSLEYRSQLTKDFEAYGLEKLEKGQLKPVIAKVLDWTQVAEAHRMMEQNENIGKIILKGM